MTGQSEFPAFDECFPELNQFLLRLVNDYQVGDIRSWDDLDTKVKAFFSPPRMAEMEALVPGWQTMASYSDGITLVHVMCAFLGMLMLPEFQRLTPEQKQLAKWIILLHDIAKFHIPGKKDTMHAFRSGSRAATLLPHCGFPTRPYYHERIGFWSKYTDQAFTPDNTGTVTPDNQKLPGILIGIDNLFGRNTPAALITKTVLLHISPAIDPNYPTPAPLTDDEIQRYVDPELFPLLRVMMFADNEGWALFNPATRAQRNRDALKAFERFEKLIFR